MIAPLLLKSMVHVTICHTRRNLHHGIVKDKAIIMYAYKYSSLSQIVCKLKRYHCPTPTKLNHVSTSPKI